MIVRACPPTGKDLGGTFNTRSGRRVKRRFCVSVDGIPCGRRELLGIDVDRVLRLNLKTLEWHDQ